MPGFPVLYRPLRFFIIYIPKYPMSDSAQTTLTLQQLLHDLQGTDLQKYNAAAEAIFPIIEELQDAQQIIVLKALATPFPLEDDNYPIRLDLLNNLPKGPEELVVQVAERLFHEYDNVKVKNQLLSILSHRATDLAMETFLRLVPQIASLKDIQGPFFHINDGFYQFLPQIISLASSSRAVLAMLCDASYNWEIWEHDKVREYGLDKLIPDILQLFRERIDAISGVPQEGEFYLLYDDVITLMELLGRPGMPPETDVYFDELLRHEDATFRVLAACALIAHDIVLPDEMIIPFLTNLDTGEVFLSHMEQYHQMGKVMHLLDQQIIANIFINRCLWARDEKTEAVQLVSRLTVRYNNGDPVVLYLSQVTAQDGENFHVFTGPYAIDDNELNFDPRLFTFLKNEAAVNDSLLLRAAAEKAYADYMEGEQDATLSGELLRQVPWRV